MKKKLQTRFPATRIKKIMQTDEDVGKIAMAVPLLVSKALELFLQDLCNRTHGVTLSRGAKTVNSFHLKQCVHTFNLFDFLREVVSKVPDLGDSEAEDRSATKRRKVVDEISYNDEDISQIHEVKDICRGGKGRRGRGRGGGRKGRRQSQKLEDDVQDGSSESGSFSLDDASWKKVARHNNNNSNSEVVNVRNFDLNVGLDENGDSATTMLEIQPEKSLGWPFLGMNEMKIDAYQQQASGGGDNEEDYDEESLDED